MKPIDKCEHNNAITSECSDCNEQELYDDMLDYTLGQIYSMLFNTNNVVTDIIDDYCNGGFVECGIRDEVEKEVSKRLNILFRIPNKI